MADISGFAGRKVKIYKGDETTGVIITCRTKTLTIGNESINVTSDSDEGYQTLLAEAAEKSLNMSVEGLIRQDDFLQAVLDPSVTEVLETYTLVIPQIGTMSGLFRFSNIEIAQRS